MVSWQTHTCSVSIVYHQFLIRRKQGLSAGAAVDVASSSERLYGSSGGLNRQRVSNLQASQMSLEWEMVVAYLWHLRY
jgi:hypothetical protein